VPDAKPGVRLAPHQLRVIDERQELDGNRMRLAGFLGSPTFNGLPEAEKERLYRQAKIMAQFSEVLGERIAAFDAP
jgi:hypothetical protein